MMSKESFLIGVLTVLSFAICTALPFGYVNNIYKLTQCDFEKPYVEEVIRSVGVVTPLGGIVGWINIPDGE